MIENRREETKLNFKESLIMKLVSTVWYLKEIV